MNETENNAPTKSRGSSELLWIVVAILIAAGLFAAVFFMPMHGGFMATSGAGASQEQLSSMERRIHTLEDRANETDARLETMSNGPQIGEQSSVRPISPSDLAHMQNDVAQVAAVIGNLQDQIKQSGSASQNSLAKMVVFIQLHDAAASDRGFAHELDAMRAATKDDPGLKDTLDKLAPYAEQGAPTIALLRERLAAQSSAAEVATAKATAQSWWERILAEFRGLVLIRPVNGGDAEDKGLEPVQAALEKDDLVGALAVEKNLSPAVQQVLGDWQKQAEARLAINAGIQAIADHLAASGVPTPAVAPAAPAAPAAMPDKETP